jgi:exo-1,4-beta-D-glucosaminidase
MDFLKPVAFVLLSFGFASCRVPEQNPQTNVLVLKENWTVVSSEKIKASGSEISQTSYQSTEWYKTQVPSTVMATLVKNGVYKDLYFGNNLEKVGRAQFNVPWWYRTEFDVKSIKDFNELIFEGINYRANIWINGKQAFSKDSVFGTFRIFKLDVGRFLVEGKNVLAVEIFKWQLGEPTLGFVDWNPEPNDNNMGLWRPVKFRQTGAVSVENVFVQTNLDKNTLKEASLTLHAEVVNHSAKEVKSELKFTIENIEIKKEVTVPANSTAKLTLTSADFAQLKIQNPRIWWPVNMGKPELYNMNVSLTANSEVSDETKVRFGIREVEDYLNADGHRGYKINGVHTIIRGGGWVDDLLLADDDKKVEDQLKYVLHTNLNTVRLEGFWGNSEKLYDLADEYGILLMAGWSCQWEWKDYYGTQDDEFGCIKSPEEMDVVAKSMRDHVLWLRNHPSVFTWVLGSDKLPRPELEKRYYADFKEVDQTRPILTACKMLKSEVSGTSGVKMAGPYDYVTPNYWYIDTQNGGAFGFNTETGPGPQPVPYESLLKFTPKENLWPIDSMWNYHCGRHQFKDMNNYLKAFNNRYGESKSTEEFCYKAQVANYEAMRAMFEAFSVNKPKATGIVQWMLNSAWPEHYWQLYDYYLMPNGAFYGARTANRPLHIVYNYGNDKIYLTNDLTQKFENLEAEILVSDINGKELHKQMVACTAESNSSNEIYQLPALKNLSKVYFVSLSLKDKAKAQVISENFYWLSTQKDVLDFAKTDWYITPNSKFADFTSLRNLKKVKLDISHDFVKTEKGYELTVNIKNPADVPALFIETSIKGKNSGKTVLPVFWSDNYVSVLPGHTKVLKANISLTDLGNDTPVFDYMGWNLEK